jgi:sortase A
MNRTRYWLYAAVPLTAAFFSLIFIAQALWIPVKAELAQWLIERSWQQALAGDEQARPWPWADTRPVGVLSVPSHNIRQMILEGNSGRNLAFGPVLLDGSAQGQDLVISGHRDTHFLFLRGLSPGDRVQIQLRDSTQLYEVSQLDVVDSRWNELVIEPGTSRLSLVTCYPFDSPSAGGPMRYVVTALPAGSDLKRPQRSPSSG